QLRVAGRSIKTSIQGGDASGEEFDLGMGDGAEFAAEIAHLKRAQILVLAKVKETLHLGRHKAHCLVDIGRSAAARIDVRLRVCQILCLDPWDPSGPYLGAARPLVTRLTPCGTRQR